MKQVVRKQTLRRSVSTCAVIAFCAATGMSLAAPAGRAVAADAAADAEASSANTVQEIIVSANRRDESAQNVPMTIQAFSGQALQDNNVASISDLLKYTPNVTFANNGPGQGNVYMRGLSAGFVGNQSSATIGNFPNVAIYLDDQSMQFPSRNVDIYMVDMERVEVLEGPQGTLFGGGAEAGALRYITNKPKLNTFEARAEGMYGFTSGGDPNDSVNAMINVPLIKDRLAIRAVVYNERQGGYINNVPSTFTRSNQDPGSTYWNIKPNAQGVCPNGQKAGGAGQCALPLSQSPVANNYAIADNAQNPTTYTGGRLSALAQINDDWNLLISESVENLDAEGIDAQFPIGSDFQALKPLQVTSFSPSFDHDRYNNTAWTLTGNIDGWTAVYTGGYTSRHIEQQQDYTNYARSVFGTYYQCIGGGTGWPSASPQCFSPVSNWRDTVNNTHITEEVRVSTPSNWRVRGIAGAFWEDMKIYDVMNFNYKSISSCTPQALAAGITCVANNQTAPGATTIDTSIRGDSTAFGEDVTRGYDQTALFGSVDFDIIPDVLTVSGGTRWYHYNEFEKGSEYFTTQACLFVPNGQCPADTLSIDSHHDKQDYFGFKNRANVTWHITPDMQTYFTFSQGFRPGGFSRATKNVIQLTSDKSTVQFLSPNGYAPDSLTNYEVGYKSELFDRHLLLNLSGYYMQWDNVQLGLFNPPLGINQTFAVNGPNYEVKGLEGQFVAKPLDGITLQGSASYNDTSQTNSPCLVSNIPSSVSFGQCITQAYYKGVGVGPFQSPFGTAGSIPAFSPKWEGNLRLRYDFKVEDYKAFATIGGNYVGSMYNQPATYPSGAGVLIPTTTQLRYLQPSYATLDSSFNVMKDNWEVGVFGSNLTNSNASQFTSSAQFIKSEVPIRPRVFGMKVSATF